ncbi:enoyl-CoA hydratase/isomerase family protein [Micromonospora sp. CPCC 206061]|uniref:enoyl-CoA hydratase/isomerase family protein n=1 Tax=Micromonospora sp. CPCC 206061 TaxID=3122410 RepID=UPI002FEEDFB9
MGTHLTSQHWAARSPRVTGGFAADTAAVADHLAAGADLLGRLPHKPDRGPDERAAAARIHAVCRRTRRAYLRRHGDAWYDELAGGCHGMRLADLVAAATAGHPGLLPDPAALAIEAGRPQRDKEGYEIDLGMVAASWLRSDRVGPHLVHAMLQPTAAARELLAEFRRDGQVDLGTVMVARDGHVGHVTIRNERFLNAEDDATVAALETAVDLVLLDDGIEVGVLRGGPVAHPRYAGRRVFSSGINLTYLYHGRITLLEFMLRRELGPMNKMLRGHRLGDDPYDDLSLGPDASSNEKPWIGVVDAFAIGGGMQQLLLLDHVVAASGSYLRMPALNEGIVPGSGNLRLTRFAGTRLARRVIFSGVTLPVEDPEGRLFCDEVLPPEALEDAVAAAAERLRNPSIVANRRLLLHAEEPPDAFRRYLAGYAWEQANLLHSATLIEKLERTWMVRPRSL